MKHLIAGLALAFALTGCGGSQKKATAPAATCADAGAHNRALYLASPDADNGTADIISTTITKSCSADGWSADAVACMATAPQEEMAACGDKLTAEQKAGLAQTASAGGGDVPPANELDNAGGE